MENRNLWIFASLLVTLHAVHPTLFCAAQGFSHSVLYWYSTGNSALPDR